MSPCETHRRRPQHSAFAACAIQSNLARIRGSVTPSDEIVAYLSSNSFQRTNPNTPSRSSNQRAQGLPPQFTLPVQTAAACAKGSVGLGVHHWALLGHFDVRAVLRAPGEAVFDPPGPRHDLLGTDAQHGVHHVGFRRHEQRRLHRDYGRDWVWEDHAGPASAQKTADQYLGGLDLEFTAG